MKRVLTAVVIELLLVCAAANAQEIEAPRDLIGWKWTNFILLVIGLGWLTAKYLPPVFRTRGEEIRKGIAEAQRLKSEAEARAAEMARKLAALGEEIEKFRAQAHAEMAQESARLAESTARNIEKLQKQAELEIETAGKIAQRDLRGHAARLALELAEARIRKLLDPKTDAALIQDFVRELEASKN